MRFVLLSLIIAIHSIKNGQQKETTIPIRHRIEILRNHLKDEIKEQIFENEDAIDKFAFSEEDYSEYRTRNGKIKPIVDPKIRMHKKIKNKPAPTEATTMKFTSELTNVTDSQLSKRNHLRAKTKKKLNKPLDIFYRRSYDDPATEEIPWAHCHYMITPFLSGVKKDITVSKGFGPDDSTVTRLLQLLKMNTTDMPKEDVYSVLYQISQLHIRLFQWGVPPIKMLLNVVIREKTHSFRTLKHGIQAMFADWKLDFSNASSLLKQTRIFRPPCVTVSDLDGSTKSPRVTLYPKKLTQQTKCNEDEDDCN